MGKRQTQEGSINDKGFVSLSRRNINISTFFCKLTQLYLWERTLSHVEMQRFTNSCDHNIGSKGNHF